MLDMLSIGKNRWLSEYFSICFFPHSSSMMDCQPCEEFCCCLSLRTGGIVISIFGIMIGAVGIVSIVILPDVETTYWTFMILLITTIGGMSN